MSHTNLTRTDLLYKGGMLSNVKVCLKFYGFWKSLSLYILLKTELRKFVKSSKSERERSFRKFMLNQFKKIRNNIFCPHAPFQHVLIAKYIFDLDVEGPIVECGVFKGGSTAQLSIIAKKTNRKLYICDSFKGLPAPDLPNENISPIFNTQVSYVFKQGEYAGSLDEVKANIIKYGCIEVCEFVPGFFNETLPKLDINPAAVIIDVDFISSARDCLRYLWPRLKQNGYFFSHEASFENYITGIIDRTWWKKTLGECPPLILGAGSGLSPITPGLALLVKR